MQSAADLPTPAGQQDRFRHLLFAIGIVGNHPARHAQRFGPSTATEHGAVAIRGTRARPLDRVFEYERERILERDRDRGGPTR